MKSNDHLKAEELFNNYSGKFKSPTITTNDILSRGDSVLLVDVRSEEEIQVSIKKNAITQKDFENLLSQDVGSLSDKVIVPYCTIGYRSGQYADSLKKKYPSFEVYNGPGVLLWAFHNAPLTCNGKETKMVHTFSSQFSVLPSTHTSTTVPWWKAILTYVGL